MDDEQKQLDDQESIGIQRTTMINVPQFVSQLETSWHQASRTRLGQ
jgi:flagellar biosynthesis chaperone FliJ